jgi:hypothetical protein
MTTEQRLTIIEHKIESINSSLKEIYLSIKILEIDCKDLITESEIKAINKSIDLIFDNLSKVSLDENDK